MKKWLTMILACLVLVTCCGNALSEDFTLEMFVSDVGLPYTGEWVCFDDALYVYLPAELIKEEITKDGNVFHYLRVKVGKYADIYLRDEDGTLALVEPEQYPMLDQIRLSKCDLSVSSREYSAGGRNGTTVYLAELFACKESKSDLYREWMAPVPDLNGDD